MPRGAAWRGPPAKSVAQGSLGYPRRWYNAQVSDLALKFNNCSDRIRWRISNRSKNYGDCCAAPVLLENSWRIEERVHVRCKGIKLFRLAEGLKGKHFVSLPQTPSRSATPVASTPTTARMAAATSVLPEPKQIFPSSSQSTSTHNVHKQTAGRANISGESNPERQKVACPVCSVEIPERNVNAHLDKCLKDQDHQQKQRVVSTSEKSRNGMKPQQKIPVYHLLKVNMTLFSGTHSISEMILKLYMVTEPELNWNLVSEIEWTLELNQVYLKWNLHNPNPRYEWNMCLI